MVIVRSLTGKVLYSSSILPQISRIKELNEKQVKVQIAVYSEIKKKFEFETLLLTFVEPEETTSFSDSFKSLLAPVEKK